MHCCIPLVCLNVAAVCRHVISSSSNVTAVMQASALLTVLHLHCLQTEVVQDQIEQALTAQKGADEKIRQLHTKVGQIEPRVDQFEEAAAAQREHNKAIRQLHTKVGQIEPRVEEVEDIAAAQRNSDKALRSLNAKVRLWLCCEVLHVRRAPLQTFLSLSGFSRTQNAPEGRVTQPSVALYLPEEGAA